MELNREQAIPLQRHAESARSGGLNPDLAPENSPALPKAPPFPGSPVQDYYSRPSIEVQGPGFEGVILGRGEDRTSGLLFYRVKDNKGVVHEAFEDELEPAGRQRNEIFPGTDRTITIEGQYPFTMKLNEPFLHTSDRQPYLVVEEGANHQMVVKAAQSTFEDALRYYKPSRWIIHPEGAKPMEHSRDAPLTLVLDNQGNPDHGQDPTRRLPGVPRKEIRVKTLAEASAKVREYIEEFGLGGGNCRRFEISHKGECVASVSYNARVWDPTGTWSITDADLKLPAEEPMQQRQPLDEEWLGDLVRQKKLGTWITSFDHPQCLAGLAEVVKVAKASAWIPEEEGMAQAQEDPSRRLDFSAMAELKEWAAGWSDFWTQGGRTRSCEATGEELARVYEKGWTALVHSELLQVQKETALALAINMVLSSPNVDAEYRMLDSFDEWGLEGRAHTLRLAKAMNQAELKLLDRAEDPDDVLVAEVGGAIFDVKDPDAAWDLYEMWDQGEFKPAAERLVPQPNPWG